MGQKNLNRLKSYASILNQIGFGASLGQT